MQANTHIAALELDNNTLKHLLAKANKKLSDELSKLNQNQRFAWLDNVMMNFGHLKFKRLHSQKSRVIL